MPIDSDLQAAGRRAATQHVPTAPSIASIEAGAAKHTSRRRMIVSGAAVVVLMALAFPLALTMRGSTTVQTVAVGTGQAGAAQVEPEPEPAAAAAAAAQEDQNSDGAGADTDADPGDGIQIQFQSGDDVSLSIRVLSGDQAVVAAEAAAASANETLDIDGVDVWVSGTGDERTVSSLVEAQEFIEVTGSAAELDMLIDVLRDGGWIDRGGRHSFNGLDDAEWQAFFDQFEDGNFNFDADGHAVDLDELFRELEGEFEGLDELFETDRDFSEFFGPDGELNFDSDGFTFDGDFSEFFGPDGELNFDGTAFGANFDGCIVIDGSDDDNGEPFHIEFPPGCSSTG